MRRRVRRQRVLSRFYRVFVTKLPWLQAPFDAAKVTLIALIALIGGAVLSRVNLIWQPQHELGEEQQQDETDHLQDHELDHPIVDLPQAPLRHDRS